MCNNANVFLGDASLDFEVPFVSVVIPNHGYDKFLLTCIVSVLRSSLQNIEVILVDSSNDKGREKTLSGILGPIMDDRRLRIFFRESFRLGDNRNFGVSKSRAEFVCSIDPDDVIHPHFLSVLYFRALLLNLDVSGSGMRAFGNIEETWHVKRFVGYRDLNSKNCLASNSLFRKSFWSSVGGFVDSSAEEHIHEDWRFWHRVSKFGARISNVDKELSCIRVHGGNMSMQSNVLPADQQIKNIRKLNKDVKPGFVAYFSKFQVGYLLLVLRVKSKIFSRAKMGGVIRSLPEVSFQGLQDKQISGLTSRVIILNTAGEVSFSPLQYSEKQIFDLPRILEQDEWFWFVRFLKQLMPNSQVLAVKHGPA